MTLARNSVVVLTRPDGSSETIAAYLCERGVRPYILPCIRVASRTIGEQDSEIIARARRFDWVVFTSANGVRHFARIAADTRSRPKNLLPDKVAVVGPVTGEALEKCGITPAFMPSRFTTAALAEEIPDPRGLNLLLLRSSIAGKDLEVRLRARGALVSNVPLYTTDLIREEDRECERLFRDGAISALVFTSASTVRGFLHRVREGKACERARVTLALCIGGVTADAAKHSGFANIRVAASETMEGIIRELDTAFRTP